MEKNYTILEPYGDHRDSKTGNYEIDIDMDYVLENLTLEDCAFIHNVIHKNVFQSNDETKFSRIVRYDIFKRGTEKWASVTIERDSDKEQFRHQLNFDSQNNYFHIHSSGSLPSSGVIMIYNYFKNKLNSVSGTKHEK